MQANELFIQPNTILLDGGMGTMLQAAGLKLGARPEELNITDPQLIESIHSRYAAAGSRIINANTFGASAHKLAGSEYTLEEIIAAGIANCKRACAPYGALAALDVGPLGELLEPNGTLAFEDAVAEYGRIVRAGVAAGADSIFSMRIRKGPMLGYRRFVVSCPRYWNRRFPYQEIRSNTGIPTASLMPPISLPKQGNRPANWKISSFR